MASASKVISFAVPPQQKLRRAKRSASKPKHEPPYPPELDYTDDEPEMLVQRLVEAARGVALCLDSMSEERDLAHAGTVLSGLASVLRIAVDQVDAGYFRSPGELVRTIDPKLLSGLLSRQIERIKGKV